MVIFTAYKTADPEFSLPTFDWENYGEWSIFLSVPLSAFELDRPEKSCAHVHVFTCLNMQNGFLSIVDDTSSRYPFLTLGIMNRLWNNVSDDLIKLIVGFLMRSLICHYYCLMSLSPFQGCFRHTETTPSICCANTREHQNKYLTHPLVPLVTLRVA